MPPKDIKQLYQEIGVSGLEQFAGRIYEDPLIQLQGVNGARIYYQMSENDPVIGALLFAIKGLIRQVTWRFNPSSDKQENRDWADFLEECKDDMEAGFGDYVIEMASFLNYGFSLSELSYKYRNGRKSKELYSSKYNDGRIGWKRLPPRAQTSILDGMWDIDDEGSVRGVWQYPITGGTHYIPIDRLLHLRTGIGRMNPQGRSILRNAYRPWYFKSRIENYEAIGVERDLAGIPIAYVPAEWFSPNSEFHRQYQAVQTIVTSIKRDEQEGLVMPNLMDENGNPQIRLELMASGGRRQYNTGEIVNRKNDEILMTSLADFIKLGQNSVGSHALAFSKTEIFTQAIRGWVKIIEDGFNRQAIPRLLRMNGYNGDMPVLKADGLDKMDGTIFLQNLKMASEAGYGYLLDEQVEQKIKSLLGLEDLVGVGIGGNKYSPRDLINEGEMDTKGNLITETNEDSETTEAEADV